MKKIASNRSKEGERGCCGFRRWQFKNFVLLALAVAIVVTQLLVFSRHYNLDRHPSTGPDAANGSSGNEAGSNNNKALRNKLLKQQQERMDLSRFAVSMSSDTRHIDTTGLVADFIQSQSQSKLKPSFRTPTSVQPSPRNITDGSDGIFNGYPIYRQHGAASDHPIHSQLHCIGETWHPPHFWKRKRIFQDASWQHRSCHFQFFCYDVQEKEYVIYLNQEERTEAAASTLSHLDDHTGHWDVSQTYYRNMTKVTPNEEPEPTAKDKMHVADIHHPYGVSIGSINGKWAQMGIPRLNWFPKVKYGPIPFASDSSNPYEVYTLPSSVVMVPFHSLSASNPGHLVWDDFLPLYTLLQIFGFTNDNPLQTSNTEYDSLLMRFVLPPEPGSDEDRGLWAGCDWLEERAEECQKMLHKFAPLMIRNEAAWQTTTQRNPQLEIFNENDGEKKKLICAKNGLAGIGGLSDHGTDKGHGWEERDYTMTYNLGRGGQLWRFRNYMIRNIGVPDPEAEVGPEEPLLVLFSANSSEKKHRAMSFVLEKRDLQNQLQKHSNKLGLPTVAVESYQFSRYTVKEQIELVSKAAVFVTTCGGGAVTATFLPRGASLLVIFPEKGGVENNKWSGKPARLDWDYFNNLGYLRVSWVPQTPATPRFPENATMVITDLIIHELQVVYEERKRRQRQ